jgi:hypothetical protein
LKRSITLLEERRDKVFGKVSESPGFARMPAEYAAMSCWEDSLELEQVSARRLRYYDAIAAPHS